MTNEILINGRIILTLEITFGGLSLIKILISLGFMRKRNNAMSNTLHCFLQKLFIFVSYTECVSSGNWILICVVAQFSCFFKLVPGNPSPLMPATLKIDMICFWGCFLMKGHTRNSIAIDIL